MGKRKLRQSSEQNTADSKYERGALVSDVNTPKDPSRSADLLSMLEPLIENADATRDTAAWQRALSKIHATTVLNDALN
ncbi:hypothetical protein M3A49_38115 [Paraburkholderia sp. CNPSo 3076]|uniref:hypothetical protein n=1 Tax=Paraburkholderia sp. CNPSo 3076 TaxID=2940936 RepID=UPI00225261D3|nr:hypothetical protein [Paraburkholderia sp. CNPSo 3076]MCX5545195.1 hypothetical protein [Paraburkholderia sp. CNPSo 3076]